MNGQNKRRKKHLLENSLLKNFKMKPNFEKVRIKMGENFSCKSI